jgi:hypothetical protein
MKLVQIRFEDAKAFYKFLYFKALINGEVAKIWGI